MDDKEVHDHHAKDGVKHANVHEVVSIPRNSSNSKKHAASTDTMVSGSPPSTHQPKAARQTAEHTSPAATYSHINRPDPAPSSTTSSSSSTPTAAHAAASAASPPPTLESGSTHTTSQATTRMSAAQQRQLLQLQNYESISSYYHCNYGECRLLYNEFTAKKNHLITQMVEFPETIGKKSFFLKMDQFAPIAGQMDYYKDIPGTCWYMPTPPGFYLPHELKLGDHCLAVRMKKKAVQAEINAQRQSSSPVVSPQPPSTAAAAAAAAVASASAAAAASSASSASNRTSPSASAPTASSTSPSSASNNNPQSKNFVDFVLDKLCDVELQQSMEDRAILNSWNEGSYLSVIKTEGDGNCLCHAAMQAVYGYPDWDGVLRDALYWALNSDAHRPQYLARFLQEQAREIGSANVLDAKKADTAVLDEADAAALTKEFNSSVERLCNPKNYLDAIHVFALANVMRRPVIVYGEANIKGAHQPSPLGNDEAAAPAQSMSTSPPAASTSSQHNSIIGIYVPLLWPDQIKLSDVTSAERNPMLKPICLLYSCGKLGERGHFSSLVPTQGMNPEPGLVPLQQWGATHNQHSASVLSPSVASNSTSSTALVSGTPPLPLLPLRFLLPAESTTDFQMHLLNKHMEVHTTWMGHVYAKQPISRTQNYLKIGWSCYLQAAMMLYTSSDSDYEMASSTETQLQLDAMAAAAMQFDEQSSVSPVESDSGCASDECMDSVQSEWDLSAEEEKYVAGRTETVRRQSMAVFTDIQRVATHPADQLQILTSARRESILDRTSALAFLREEKLDAKQVMSLKFAVLELDAIINQWTVMIAALTPTATAQQTQKPLAVQHIINCAHHLNSRTYPQLMHYLQLANLRDSTLPVLSPSQYASIMQAQQQAPAQTAHQQQHGDKAKVVSSKDQPMQAITVSRVSSDVVAQQVEEEEEQIIEQGGGGEIEEEEEDIDVDEDDELAQQNEQQLLARAIELSLAEQQKH